MRRASGHAARACVLGDIDLVRPLALAGIRSVVVARPGDPLWFSRYAEPGVAWADAWTQRALLVERLMEFGISQPAPPVLFYQGTPDLLTVSRNRERLAQAFRFTIADAALIEELTDKAAFQALAERLRLPVPATRRLRPAEDPAGWDVDLRFPLILKPVVRRPAEWSRVEQKAKAVKIATRDELRTAWPRLVAADVELLAQELIAGPESMIESYHTYVEDQGTVVAEFTGRKLRTRPAEFGNSTAVTITEAPDVAATGRQIVRCLGLAGSRSWTSSERMTASCCCSRSIHVSRCGTTPPPSRASTSPRSSSPISRAACGRRSSHHAPASDGVTRGRTRPRRGAAAGSMSISSFRR
jgi:D-aspartate ligase